jgi:hypothetical protein
MGNGSKQQYMYSGKMELAFAGWLAFSFFHFYSIGVPSL